MHAIIAWLSSYLHSLPLVVFIALLLGGFNLPISEDILVIISAVACQRKEANVPIAYAAIFFGATISDWLVYLWGWLLGRGFISNKLFSKVVTKENTLRFSRALEKYGIFTYIFVRFIPFGVRNVMSITSGFVSFNFFKFALFDSIAAFCNTSALFWVIYFFGKTGGKYFKIFGIVLFCSLIIFGIYIFHSKKLSKFIDKHLIEKESK